MVWAQVDWKPASLRLTPVAQQLFMLLASIEFVVSGIIWTLRNDTLDESYRAVSIARPERHSEFRSTWIEVTTRDECRSRRLVST